LKDPVRGECNLLLNKLIPVELVIMNSAGELGGNCKAGDAWQSSVTN